MTTLNEELKSEYVAGGGPEGKYSESERGWLKAKSSAVAGTLNELWHKLCETVNVHRGPLGERQSALLTTLGYIGTLNEKMKAWALDHAIIVAESSTITVGLALGNYGYASVLFTMGAMVDGGTFKGVAITDIAGNTTSGNLIRLNFNGTQVPAVTSILMTAGSGEATLTWDAPNTEYRGQSAAICLYLQQQYTRNAVFTLE